jgi:hypothetical protein
MINKLYKELAFRWCIKDALKKRDRILSKVKSCYWKRIHKFGIELPKTVEDALALDRKNDNNFWKLEIEK